jgi:tetratricopeptide (TPR) repeat protein
VESELAEADFDMRLQRVDEAQKHYRNALVLDAKSVDAYRGLAKAKIQARRYGEAVAALRKALELEPGDPNLLRLLGDLLVAQGRHAEGMDAYRRLLDLNPGDEDALRGLASQLAADRQFDEAASILERLVRVAPRSASTHGHLGDVYLRLNRKREAAAAFRGALALEPKLAAEAENLGWANNLAWLLATDPEPEMRDGKDAVRWAKQACEAVQYKEIQLIDTLAAAYAEAGDFRRAVTLARKCLAEAERDGQTQSIEVFRNRMKLYESGRPYRAS